MHCACSPAILRHLFERIEFLGKNLFVLDTHSFLDYFRTLFADRRFRLSFLAFFSLLAAYYILRPIRETMATIYGEVDELFVYVFFIMFGLVPIFGFLVGRYKRKTLIQVTTRFFSLCLVCFSILLFRFSEIPPYLAASYFVWLSIFSLFTVSLFWSFMADIYSPEDGKKFFAAIAAGGSLGGMIASLFTGSLVSICGLAPTLLIPVLLLELYLNFTGKLEGSSQDVPPKGEGVLAGFSYIFNNKYLLSFAAFMILGKFCATMIYLQMIDTVAAVEPIVEARTVIFARANLAVQIISMIFQIYLTEKIIGKIGISYTLIVLPLILSLGFVGIHFWQSLGVIVSLQIIQRSLAYGLAKPAKEILFTIVSREEKYKAKNCMDTVLDRGADALSSKFYAFAIVSLADEQILVLVLGLGLAWSAVAWSLGWQYERVFRRSL